MYIFIDESGVFLPTENNSCSTVGALCVPDEAIDQVERALTDLKESLGIQNEDEIKRPRPDCTSKPFESFIAKLVSLNCTFEALVTNISLNESETIVQAKNNVIESMKRYIEIEKIKGDQLEFVMNVINLTDSLSLQLFQQVYMQCYLIVGLVEKVLNFYAKHSPESLSSFKWRIDQKGIKPEENSFEKVFQSLYLSIAVSASLRNPMRLVYEESNNFSYFFHSFNTKHNSKKLENEAKLREIDISVWKNFMRPISLQPLLAKDFSFTDSKTSKGLQIVDLLVSSTNRCLKRNFDDNEKMAKLLGGLMINSPDYGKYAIRTIIFDGNIDHSENIKEKIELYELMEKSSKKIFTEEFKENLFINKQKLEKDSV
ncbi:MULTISPECIES: DUF3800 domain-containing protein [Acinetobacter]|uniref:DUF3800 domain-containing protein n=1 Tax=Acinetobacter TaxID=469 RepID=UPI00073874C7|nr:MULTISPECIES: DUF3800 domain-containing protein [Acinetobacter]AXF43611.1 DUF3800 domain-containing protein [Acinetobacter johnsonii]KUG37574.1 hypothetical protein AAU60_14655 [Acinetobacter johnsonii]MDH1277969.1 DUF3800 domain-containing protein [Acinetobacter johnsonii]UNT43761.1 DUF3800 domain-containing protein [Acinetobacter sp. LUNF3]